MMHATAALDLIFSVVSIVSSLRIIYSYALSVFRNTSQHVPSFLSSC